MPHWSIVIRSPALCRLQFYVRQFCILWGVLLEKIKLYRDETAIFEICRQQNYVTIATVRATVRRPGPRGKEECRAPNFFGTTPFLDGKPLFQIQTPSYRYTL